MILSTESYGEIEYFEEDLLTFSDGIFGFPDLTCYLLLSLSEDENLLLILQSVQKPEVSFAVMNPVILCPDYAPQLTPEELFSLNVSDSEELSYYVICVVREHYLDDTINLKCPLAINPQTLKGIQVILEGSEYQFNHRLGSFLSDSEQPDSENHETGNRGEGSC